MRASSVRRDRPMLKKRNRPVRCVRWVVPLLLSVRLRVSFARLVGSLVSQAVSSAWIVMRELSHRTRVPSVVTIATLARIRLFQRRPVVKNASQELIKPVMEKSPVSLVLQDGHRHLGVRIDASPVMWVDSPRRKDKPAVKTVLLVSSQAPVAQPNVTCVNQVSTQKGLPTSDAQNAQWAFTQPLQGQQPAKPAPRARSKV